MYMYENARYLAEGGGAGQDINSINSLTNKYNEMYVRCKESDAVGERDVYGMYHDIHPVYHQTSSIITFKITSLPPSQLLLPRRD